MNSLRSFFFVTLVTSFSLLSHSLFAIDIEKQLNAEELKVFQALKSLGLKVKSATTGPAASLKLGDSLSAESFEQLSTDPKWLTLVVNEQKADEAIAAIKQIHLVKALESTEVAKAWRVKFGSSVQSVSGKIGEALEWPYDGVDALGTGWTPVFTKVKPSKAELVEQLGEDANDLSADDREYYGSLMTYWHAQAKPAAPLSKVLKDFYKKNHSSGCLVALNTFVHLSVFDTYFNFESIFDDAFKEIKISNQVYRTTPLFPNVPSNDWSGVKKAKLGLWGIVGHGGYIRALLQEKVDNPDYSGENIMFTSISEAALKDLVAEGLGYNEDEDFDLDGGDVTDLNEALEQGVFSGMSLQMVEWWKAYSATYKKINGTRIIAESKKEAAHLKTLEAMPKAAQKILERPFFSETKVWGHPAGEQVLADWIKDLAGYNPRTPYGMYIYDYHLGSDQCNNYFNAFLGTKFKDAGLEAARVKALKNCKQFD